MTTKQCYFDGANSERSFWQLAATSVHAPNPALTRALADPTVINAITAEVLAYNKFVRGRTFTQVFEGTAYQFAIGGGSGTPEDPTQVSCVGWTNPAPVVALEPGLEPDHGPDYRITAATFTAADGQTFQMPLVATGGGV